MPRSKKENIEEITLDPIEEKVKDPAPVEEPIEELVEPETIEECEDIAEPDAPIEPEFEEPEEGEQGEDVEFDEEEGEEEGEDAPEEDAPPFLGLMLGAKNEPVSEDPDPQSRIEALLRHIINGTTTDAVPQSRNEAILKAIANSGTYTEEAQSRIEALLISILNHEESDIAPISRNEAILKAIANNTEYNEEPQSRNEELLIEWLEAISIVIGTASGAVASFNTSLTEPLIKCECDFSASQASGTQTPSTPIPIVGVDKVNVACCGKNLFDPNTAVSGYIATDGNIASASTTSKEKTGDYVAVKDTSKYLTLSLDYGTTQEGWGGFGWYDANKNFISRNATTQSSVTKLSISRKPPENAKYFRATLRTYGNTDIQVEITETTTATDYEPYNGTTALINLGGTYYGGYIDAVTGKITLTRGSKTFLGGSDEDWSNYAVGNGYYINIPEMKSGNNLPSMSNSFPQYSGVNDLGLRYGFNNSYAYCYQANTITGVSDLTSWKAWLANNPLVMVYELATPIVVYASNTAEIPTIVGDNQVFADTGDVAVEYKKRRND